jgi:hypothetical protein
MTNQKCPECWKPELDNPPEMREVGQVSTGRLGIGDENYAILLQCPSCKLILIQ